MPQNSNFLLPQRSSIFCKKSKLRLWRQITVGIPWGPSRSQWGPIGIKKWVKTVKNYHASKFEFWLPRSSIFTQKNRSYSYSAKSRWGPPRVRLGAKRVPLGPKKVKTVKTYYAAKFQFLAKNRSYGYGTKSQWGPTRVHLGANGVPLGPKKWVKTVKN